MRARPWLATACAGALVGAVIGLFLPIRAASPSKAEETRWSLPTPAAVKRFDDARYQSVRSARFWGAVQTPGARGKQVAAWTLAGIVTRPAVRIAVTATGKPVVSWLRPGETLPDGATFVAADRDTVWYEKDGCRRARKLYEKPAADSEACIGAKAASTTVAQPGRPTSAPSVPSPAAPPARKPH